jgi:hypothetical protein
MIRNDSGWRRRFFDDIDRLKVEQSLFFQESLKNEGCDLLVSRLR